MNIYSLILGGVGKLEISFFSAHKYLFALSSYYPRNSIRKRRIRAMLYF